MTWRPSGGGCAGCAGLLPARWRWNGARSGLAPVFKPHPKVYGTAEDVAALAGLDLAQIAITSLATLIEGVPPEGAFRLDDVADIGVVPGFADGQKCERCWMVLDDVGRDPVYPDLCARCADAVANMAHIIEVGG